MYERATDFHKGDREGGERERESRRGGLPGAISVKQKNQKNGGF